MKKHSISTFFAASLALLAFGCGAIAPPPAQAHLAKSGENPVVILGPAGSTRAATCRSRNATMIGTGTLGTKVQLRLACREGIQPAWTVQVIATCTDISEAGGDCIEKGSWTLKWSGRAEIDREQQELGTSRHTAAAFQKFLESLEPQAPNDPNKDVGEPAKQGRK